MNVKTTIIGLGQVGASIGLALSAHTDQVVRIGHDKDLKTAKAAEKAGALDRVVMNLHKAVEDADLVILAVPVDEVTNLITQIAPDLKEGAVLLDTSPLKTQISSLASSLLPAGRHFVTFTPTINPIHLEEIGGGLNAAHNDLFKNSQIVITVPPGTEGDAIKLACDLAALLGAQTLFTDPLESDGLTAAVRQLPMMTAAGIVRSVGSQPGWTEARKIAGKAFVHATWPALHLDETEKPGQSLLMNRENALRVLDNLIHSLQDLRRLINEDDSEGLQAYMRSAQEVRAVWWKDRQQGDWEASLPAPDLPTSGEMLGHLIGIRPKRAKPTD